MSEGMKFCPHCGTEAVPGHRFCSNCGQPLDGAKDAALERPPVEAAPVEAPPQAPQAVVVVKPAEKRKGSSLWWLVIAVLGFFAVVGFFTQGSSDSSKSSSSVPPTAAATAPRFADIWANMQGMTEAQYEHYFDGLEGHKAVNWTGWVSDVDERLSGRYRVRIDMVWPNTILSTNVVKFTVPESVALSLRKNERVRFSGYINRISEVLGSLVITLEDEAIIESFD